MSSPQVVQNVYGDGNFVTGTGDIHITNIQSAPAAADRRNLVALLRNVQQFWIEGVLQSSIHGALLALDKQTAPDAVEHPWEMQLALPDDSSRALPPETPVVQVYQETGCSLLILGDPGSGKTTTLLELARDLIAEAEKDPQAPVPVVFLLSSWTPDQPLASWLVSELNRKYGVSRKVASGWLNEHRLAVLLDGLDEVAQDSRGACVDAIHTFAEELPPSGMVVTCRAEEYAQLGHRLRMRGAVRIGPLTPAQVEKYLDGAPALAGLRSALAADPVLRELAASPLMLAIMSLAYRNAPAEALADGTPGSLEERRTDVFRQYVAAAYGRKGKEQPYPLTDVNLRLSWLAQRLNEHGQTMFLLEQMQPSWLRSAGERAVYVFVSRMAGFLVLFAAPAALAWPVTWISPELRLPLLLAMSIWAPLGLFCSARDLFAFEKRREQSTARRKPAVLVSVGRIALSLYVWLYELIFFNLFWLRSRRRDFNTDIQLVEHIVISWPRAWQAARKGARWGTYFGIATGILISIPTVLDAAADDMSMVMMARFTLVLTVLSIFLWGGVGALVTGIFSLAQVRTVETKRTPNQGIRLSIRSACLIALAIGGPVLLAAVPVLLTGSTETGSIVVLVGLCLAAAGFLVFGGQDAIQHGVLRVILVRRRYIPRRYDAFLDHSVRLVLLQKVGGGYRFVHRLLQDYFAREIGTPPVSGSS
jgi:DNA polymerase III delta prime subunit